MQFERFYSLKQSVVAWFAHFYQVWFQPIWGKICGGNSVIVEPYAFAQPEKVLKHLKHVSHGHGIEEEHYWW